VKAMVAAFLAAAVLVVGGLPVLALALDDGGHRDRAPGSHRSWDKGPYPRGWERCVHAFWKSRDRPDETRPGDPGQGVPGDLGNSLQPGQGLRLAKACARQMPRDD